MGLWTGGQSGVALDQWFEAITHTLNSNCVSAADDADYVALGRPALASQEKLDLRDELSDLISGRCETHQGLPQIVSGKPNRLPCLRERIGARKP